MSYLDRLDALQAQQALKDENERLEFEQRRANGLRIWNDQLAILNRDALPPLYRLRADLQLRGVEVQIEEDSAFKIGSEPKVRVSVLDEKGANILGRQIQLTVSGGDILLVEIVPPATVPDQHELDVQKRNRDIMSWVTDYMLLTYLARPNNT